MYDIRQFRPMLYVLLLIGFTGYGIAADALGLWLLAVVGTLLNAYLIHRGSFKPLPRFVANLITLAFAGLLLLKVRSPTGTTIFAIGEFLIYLQLVKLFEQRGNRDIAQLLVLSLLLMVAAAISTASLGFGLLFLGYLFLSLYCCLLFHLKAESDHARHVMGLDESKLNPMTLRQDQRFLSRSMRRLTVVVSCVAVLIGTFVFLAFPRSIGAGMIGQLSLRPQSEMTGFNETINFQDVAKITQNEAEVAWVAIHKNGQPWGGPGQTIYLRGSAPDTYNSDPKNSERWKWIRTAHSASENIDSDPRVPPGTDLYQQDIRLLPIGTHTLFALPGLLSFTSKRDVHPTRGASDDVLMTFDQGNTELNYTVVSTNTDAIPYRDPGPDTNAASADATARKSTSYPVPQAVRDFALRDDVAGSDAKGNLAVQRLKMTEASDLDERLARNFETYLRTNFKYTLDLSDVSGIMGEQDPLVQFLYDFKKGHCEYFAGSMALLCQSLGMKARVVVGFKCDEFNTLGNYYVVRQSHAHAWVEVLTPRGWMQFDPTSSNEAAGGPRSLSVWQRMRSVVSFLEYKWGNAVVNYDTDTRQNLIYNADNGLTSTAVTTSQWFADLKSWFGADNGEGKVKFMTVFSGVLMALTALMIVTVVMVVMYFLYERLRLYRRARRIGLEALPSDEQRRLARQLAFYDDLLKVLERHHIVRAGHLTPREFGASVGFLPAEVFDAVQRLTRIFYRVRYGQVALQPAQQRRLVRSVERLDTAIGPVGR